MRVNRSSSFSRSRTAVVAFAGWNDAGRAATETAAFVRTSLRLMPRATMPAETYYDLRAVRPIAVLEDDGETALIWPSPVLYGPAVGADDGPAVFVLQGAEPSLNWTAFCRDLVDLLASEGIGHLLLLGSMGLDVPHRGPVVRYVHSLDAAVRRELDIVRSEYEGPVGILTVLADIARRAGVPAVSVWGCVPSYFDDDPSPKIVAAMAAETAAILGADLPIADLQPASDSWERRADLVVAEDEELSAFVAKLEAEFEVRTNTGGDQFAEAIESFLAQDTDDRRNE